MAVDKMWRNFKWQVFNAIQKNLNKAYGVISECQDQFGIAYH
jgi:hypothetical protein